MVPLCILAAATGNGGMFNAWQPGEIAPAGRNDEAVIADLAVVGFDHPATVTDTACRAPVEYHPFAAEKILQVDRDIVPVANPRRDPDEARVIEKFRLLADDGDLG
jgi:hypothetical protein